MLSLKKTSDKILQFLRSQNLFGILSALVLAAATVFVISTKYVKSKKASSLGDVVASAQPASEKPVVTETSMPTMEPSLHVNLSMSTGGGRIEVVDLVGDESCPLEEISSYQRSSFSSARRNNGQSFEDEGDAQSKEMTKNQQRRSRNKRESLASPASEFSTASATYGSFTTYLQFKAQETRR